MSRHHSPWTPEIYAEAAKLRAKGMSFPKLAAKYGLSRETIRVRLESPAARENRLWIRSATRPSRGSGAHAHYHTTTPGPPVPGISSFTYYCADLPGLPPLERSALWARLSESEREALRGRVQRGEPIR